MDDREEKLGYRIREAQMKKIPYQLVLGDSERDNNYQSTISNPSDPNIGQRPTYTYPGIPDYQLYEDIANNINKLFDATIEDWYFITGSVGLRLSYKNTNVPNQTKIRKLKDILSLTFLDAKSKQFF